jgi:hypothetical protein
VGGYRDKAPDDDQIDDECAEPADDVCSDIAGLVVY